MSQKLVLSVRNCLLVVSLTIVGCQRSQQDIAEQDIMVSHDQGKTWEPSTKAPRKEGPKPPALTRSQLKNLNLGYSHFCAVYGRAPGNVDEFAPLLVATTFPESARQQEEECLQQLKQGKYAIMWNHDDLFKVEDDTYVLTAYESRTAKEGGFVVFADARVEWMTPAEFAEASKRHAPAKKAKPDSTPAQSTEPTPK